MSARPVNPIKRTTKIALPKGKSFSVISPGYTQSVAGSSFFYRIYNESSISNNIIFIGTIYSIEGATVEKIILDLNRCRKKPHTLSDMFVMISRVRRGIDMRVLPWLSHDKKYLVKLQHNKAYSNSWNLLMTMVLLTLHDNHNHRLIIGLYELSLVHCLISVLNCLHDLNPAGFNLCYVNTIVQVLFQSPSFKNSVINSDYSTHDARSQVHIVGSKLKIIFEALVEMKTPPTNLMTDFVISIGFPPGAQQDAEECFENIITRLQLISDSFYGHSEANLFIHLLILIPNNLLNPTLIQLINNHHQINDHSEIVLFPVNLCIALARYTYDDVHPSIKQDDKVVIPEIIDTKDILAYAELPNNYTYSLYAVLLHLGVELNSGHYTCYVKSIDKEWFYFNDNVVRKCRIDEVLQSAEEAYCLFYTQIVDV